MRSLRVELISKTVSPLHLFASRQELQSLLAFCHLLMVQLTMIDLDPKLAEKGSPAIYPELDIKQH